MGSGQGSGECQTPTGPQRSTVNQDLDAGCERTCLRSGRGSGAAAPCGQGLRFDVRLGDCGATSVPPAGSDDLREPAPVLFRAGCRGRPPRLGACDRRGSGVQSHVVVLEAVVDCEAAGARGKRGTAHFSVVTPGSPSGTSRIRLRVMQDCRPVPPM